MYTFLKTLQFVAAGVLCTELVKIIYSTLHAVSGHSAICRTWSPDSIHIETNDWLACCPLLHLFHGKHLISIVSTMVISNIWSVVQ